MFMALHELEDVEMRVFNSVKNKWKVGGLLDN